MGNKRATIYDIAKEAGLSAGTVSRIINDKPGIKSETRARVLALLEKYNYSPNEAARGLSRKESKLIGILVADIRNAHHADIAYVLERELTDQGYSPMIFNTGLESENKALSIQRLAQRRVDGAILVGSTFQDALVEQAIQEHLPDKMVVITNGYISLPNVFGVLMDDVGGLTDCVDYMFAKKYERLAFVLPNQTPANLRKCQGFINGMLAHGTQNALVYKDCVSADEGYAMAKRILSENPDIQGIIYGEDLPAVGAIRALSDMGLKIPDDVAIMGVDNSLYGTLCNPRLTSLDNKLVEMSKEAVRILLAALSNELPQHKIMLFANIVEREST